MFAHQPGKGGAVLRPVGFAQVIGAGAIHAKGIHYIAGHAKLDLVEQPRLGWIKRVVEVKNPCRYM